MKNLFSLKSFIAIIFLLIFTQFSFGQTLPYTIENSSTYPDDQVYVAIVGITDGHVWLDAATGQVNPMSSADNTMAGPVISGNQGPGENGMYADCFRKLSSIPNNTINIPQISGCRILISFESPLYLYFFGHSGDPSGYAAPNLANATDPNQGIKYEVVELTYNQYGLWCNTTRVDFYQYPMGLEVWGGNNFYKKVGEIKAHEQILQDWKNTVPAPFQACLDEEKDIIHFPSKTSEFPTDYFDGYIDAIWAKYRNEELAFYSGDAGTWRGTVSGDVFTFHRDRDGQVAYINSKPSQQEALEGSGAFASGGTFDLIVQAQLCAAITRHAIDLNVPSGVVQDFGNTGMYYQTEPYNQYSKFFHNHNISFEGQTYTFCYDDVFDQSATVHTPDPQNITITLGGFYGTSDDSGDDGGNNDSGESLFIEAENYTMMSGVELEACSDDNGGQNVGWIDAGDWMLYDVTVPQTGVYEVSFRVASPNSNGIIQMEQAGGGTVFGTVNVPNTGGWQNWQTVSLSATLNAGAQQIAVVAPVGGYNLNWLEVSAEPFVPTNIAVEAEDYTMMNGIDLEACSDVGGGQNVGWIDTGDWMVWDVDIPEAGSYVVSYRVASPNSTGVIQLEQAGGGTVFGTVNVPGTGGWQTWQTVNHTVSLNAGAQQIAIYAAGGGFNINWFQIGNGLKSAAAEESAFSNEQQNGFNVFPVPAENRITVEGVDDDAVISVYSLDGIKVLESYSPVLNVSDLTTGVYVVVAEVDGQPVREKIYKK
jgi:hypothetical protein